MRRREFLTLPALAGVSSIVSAKPAGLDLRATLRLTSAHPFDEFTRLWQAGGYGPARHITTRAHPGWWPSTAEVPDRWQAWIELADRSAVRVCCQPRQTPRPPERPLCPTAARLRDTLKA